MSPRGRKALQLLVPVTAVLVALLVSGVVLAVLGVDPIQALVALFDFGPTSQAQANQMRAMLNGTTALFLAGVAVSIGFRANLFNIGVEGQYRVATVVAAGVGAMLALPQVLHLLVIVLVAMLVGAAYAAVPAVLKVTRGVNEVITTIMLNSIAVALAAYLVRGPFLDPTTDGSTKVLPESARFPGFQDLFLTLGLQPPTRPVTGMIVVAVVVGVAVSLMLSRTRFGFELRASGANPSAAASSGIPSKRMVMQAMLLSGALAGLIGLPELLSEDMRYGVSFTAGLGFTGIAVALLGRNNPAGIALAALLFAFLDRAGPSLEGVDIPPSVATIVQGTIVMTVVIVNEVVGRALSRAEERWARTHPPATGRDQVQEATA
ncbi:ABC transporter permease [Thalassiella azotivora]